MNLQEAAELVRVLLKTYGVSRSDRIPRTVIDTIIQAEYLSHFQDVKSYKRYYHALVQENMDEYDLPSSLIAPTMIKVANERYYPAAFPYVEDAKTLSSGGVKVTGDGYTVDVITDRWYWVYGEKLFLHPAPAADTGEAVSDTCTVAGSIVTFDSGTPGAKNSAKNKLALVGSNYFIILSNTTTVIVVDGTPDAAATDVVIYNHGLEIWGEATPPELTIGSTDNLAGDDIDALAIVYSSAFKVAMTLPDSNKINMNGLIAAHLDMKKRAKNKKLTKEFAPKSTTPWTLRRNHAGLR